MLTFHSPVSLDSWPSISLPLMLPHLYFFKLNFFVAFPFVIFPKWVESFPAKLKVFPVTFPYGSSFWVTLSTSLLLVSCCSPNPLVLCCITVCLRRTYLSFVSCYFWFPSWAVSISLWLRCTSQGSQAQFFLLDFLWSSDLGKLGPFISSLYFMGS